MTKPPAPPFLIDFMYLGRQGSLGQFTWELAKAVGQSGDIAAGFIVSRNSDLFAKLKDLGSSVHAIPTFDNPMSAALITGFPRARKSLDSRLAARRPHAIINLMPHVWSPLLAPTVKRRKSVFMSVIHDAVPHPGDNTAQLTRWLMRDAKRADRVLTLSGAVAQSLATQNVASGGRISTLFHPDLRFDFSGEPRRLVAGQPLRILFLGRIMAYKGLNLLIDAVYQLRESGMSIRLGVAGSGAIAPASRIRLEELGAEVMNRWIRDDEISAILARYDVMACAHIEASQSGVAATAFGHAMPVVAMPVGGIAEQVIDGKTGVLAARIDADAFAEALCRLVNEAGLYNTISKNLLASKDSRSMDRFLTEVFAQAKREHAAISG